MIEKFKKIKYYILVLLGLISCFSFIYINFIRERLPKNIPFNLTEIQIVILIYICIVYIYLIKTLIYPKPLNTKIYTLVSYITLPFVYIDSFLKYNKYIFPYYYQILFQYLTSKLDECDQLFRSFLIYIFQILPRIILVSILMVDVFWLHNIAIFYYFIFLSIFPLIYRYVKYSLEFALKQAIKHLECKYEDVWILEEGYKIIDWIQNPKAIHHDTIVTIQEYLKIQYELILNYDTSDEYYDYIGRPFAKEYIYKQYREIHDKINKKLTDQDYNIIHKEFNELIPKLFQLYCILEVEKTIQSKFYIIEIKIALNSLYLICWIYILIISFHTLKDFDTLLYILEILNKYYIFEEPFTGLHNYNINMYINKDFILYCYNAIKNWGLIKIILFLIIMIIKKK